MPRASALTDPGEPARTRSPATTTEGIRLEHDRTLSQIAHGLTWIGGAFLVASGAVIVWAVFRTVGVDDLLVALTVAGLGLGLPAIVAFVVAWILNSLGHPDAELRQGSLERANRDAIGGLDERKLVGILSLAQRLDQIDGRPPLPASAGFEQALEIAMQQMPGLETDHFDVREL